MNTDEQIEKAAHFAASELMDAAHAKDYAPYYHSAVSAIIEAAALRAVQMIQDQQKPTKRKQRATLEEMRAFAKELGMPESDGESLFYHWESNGWKNGANPVKDWKAGFRKWKSCGYLPSQKGPNGMKPKPCATAGGFLEGLQIPEL